MRHAMLVGLIGAGCTETRYHVQADVLVDAAAAREAGGGTVLLWIDVDEAPGGEIGRVLGDLGPDVGEDVVLSGSVSGGHPCDGRAVTVRATLEGGADSASPAMRLTSESVPLFTDVGVCGHVYYEDRVELTLDQLVLE